ncbi:unnamed protein product [Mytilus edulis]|uniref:Ion transport domain-containing protein n=1 Tax=Mytilus edulis TaxID=6550 RepID=A0A8S3PWK6_MYTED|nr:unnamed protein product [Mytilus edulis]
MQRTRQREYKLTKFTDFYRNNEVHIPSGICGSLVEKELEFWKIPFEGIAECCRSRFLNSENELETIKEIKHAFAMHNTTELNVAETKQSWFNRIWLFLEEPLTSTPAKVYNIIYILVVVLSAIMAFLFTCEEMREQYIDIDTLINVTTSAGFNVYTDRNNPKDVLHATTILPIWWYTLDRFFLVFFTLEYFIRLIVCPSKIEFLKNWLNIMDLILNVSMWTRFCLEMNITLVMNSYTAAWIFGMSYCTISLRLIRIFRIYKQYLELRVLLLSLKTSFKELLLLLVTFIVISALFANFIYYAEFQEPSTFPSSFSGLWWSVVTMTTVGYGDVYAKSTPGKIVGCLCAVCGLLILAMPIAIIATNFSNYYQKMKDISKFKKKINSSSRQNKISASAVGNKVFNNC